MAISTVLHSKNSPDNFPLSHSVLLVFFFPALLVLSTLYFFTDFSFSLNIILCD